MSIINGAGKTGQTTILGFAPGIFYVIDLYKLYKSRALRNGFLFKKELAAAINKYSIENRHNLWRLLQNHNVH